jgi:hypothetical protein
MGDACVRALDIVWKTLTDLGLTNGKVKPLVGIFAAPIDCQAAGLNRPEVGTVYVKADFAESLTEQLIFIVVEQVIHYVSGGAGYSREFQAMQAQVIGRLVQTRCLEPHTGRQANHP